MCVWARLRLAHFDNFLSIALIRLANFPGVGVGVAVEIACLERRDDRCGDDLGGLRPFRTIVRIGIRVSRLGYGVKT
jgi:hypothetical protein